MKQAIRNKSLAPNQIFVAKIRTQMVQSGIRFGVSSSAVVKAVAQARTCGMLGAMLLFKLWLVVETQPPRGWQ
eukprot:3985947-Amphidinium_carterae.1